MPKELTFNINANSNLSALIKELKDLKAAVDDVNKSSGGGGGGSPGSPRSPRHQPPPDGLGLSDKMLRDAEKAARARDKLVQDAARAAEKQQRKIIDDANKRDARERAKSDKAGEKQDKSGGLSFYGMTGALLVASAIKNMIKESQIVSKFLGTVSKLLGTLVDLVLLPFLPILIWVIMGLTSAIMLLLPLLKPANAIINPSPSSTDPIESGAAKGIKLATPEGWPIDIPTLVGAIFGAIVGAILGGEWGAVIGAAIGALLVRAAYTLGSGFMEALGKLDPAAMISKLAGIIAGASFGSIVGAILGGILGSLLGPAGTVAGAALGAVLGGIVGAVFTSVIWDAMYNLGDKFYHLLAGWWENIGLWIEYIKGLISGLSWDSVIAGFKVMLNAMIMLLNAPIKAINIPLGFLTGQQIPELPYLDSGGTIEKTGVAVVHKGETVVPAGQGTGSLTLNFYGYQDDKFIAKVKDVLRSEGTRYQV